MATTTTQHQEIRRWAEERGGRPARVKGTGGGGDDAGLLRIDFGEREENLEEVDWDAWFKTFDANELAFLFEDESDSRFNKLIARDSG